MIVKAPLAKSKGNTFREYLLKVLLKVVSFGTFIYIYTHMLCLIFPGFNQPPVDFCQLQLLLQQNGWANKNIKRHILVFRRFQKLILYVLHSQSCTQMKSAKSNSVRFLLYTFRHNKCWQLTWVVDQVQKYTFEPSSLFTKKYTNKKHEPSSTVTGVNKNGGASLRNHGTNSWRVPQCSAMPVVMQWPWPCRCRHDARVPQRPPCGHAPGYAPARCETKMGRQHTSHLKHVFLLLLLLPLLLQKKRHRSKQEKW